MALKLSDAQFRILQSPQERGGVPIVIAKPILMAAIYTVVILIVSLYLFVAITHGVRSYRKRREAVYAEKLLPALNAALSQGELAQFQKSVQGVPRRYIENLLMDVLYEPVSSRVKSALELAQSFGFPQEAVQMLSSRRVMAVALACRKSGLYRNRDAAQRILVVLRGNASSMVQFHAITALALIGDVDAMAAGMEIIGGYIMLNERTLLDIINSFEGDRVALYRRMIAHDVDYIASIFIKSMQAGHVRALRKEVRSQWGSADTERLIATIRALSLISEKADLAKLRRMLKDERWQVRAAVAKALGSYAAYDPSEELSRALTDSNWWVRTNAAQSLLGLTNAKQVAKRVLGGPDRFARECLSSAIREQGGPMVALLEGVS